MPAIKQRAPKSAPGVVPQRVEHIADLLAKGLYRTHETPRELAAEWGLEIKTVENYASEAARLVRRAVGDDEQIRGTMIATLDSIRAECLGRAMALSPNARNGHQYFTVAITAIDRLAGLVGLHAPQRHEVKTEVSLDDVDKLLAAARVNECNQPTEPKSSLGFFPTSEGSAGPARSSGKTDSAAS